MWEIDSGGRKVKAAGMKNAAGTLFGSAPAKNRQTSREKYKSSIASIRGLLRPAFQMAVEDDILRKNIFDFRLCDVITNDSVKRDALTGKQEKTFLEFVKNDEHFSQYYDMMLILFKTGVRVSEMCGLTLKDIDLKEKTIAVNKQLHYRKDKDGKSTGLTKTVSGARVLPMSEEVYEAFKRVVAEKKKSKVDCIIDGYSGFLFMTEKGKPIVGFQVHKDLNMQYKSITAFISINCRK